MPFNSGLFTGCEAWDQVQGRGEVAGLLGGIRAAVVRQMLDRVRGSHGAEALLDRLQHHVAYIGAADAGTADGGPGNDLAIEGIDDEGHADDIAVPAGELQAVGAPAQVRAHHHDLAVVEATFAPTGMALKQHGVALHDTMDPLAVCRRHSLRSAFPVHQRRDAAIAVGRPLVDEAADQRQEVPVVRLAIRATRLRSPGPADRATPPAPL